MEDMGRVAITQYGKTTHDYCSPELETTAHILHPRPTFARTRAYLYTSHQTDGKEALPGAVECLEELRTKGKRMVILSNTSKREAFTMNRLPKYGFRSDLFDGGVTSGEVRDICGHDALVLSLVCRWGSQRNECVFFMRVSKRNMETISERIH